MIGLSQEPLDNINQLNEKFDKKIFKIRKKDESFSLDTENLIEES